MRGTSLLLAVAWCAVSACTSLENASDAGADAGDAAIGDGATSRTCPTPTPAIRSTVACAVDPSVTCMGDYGAPACVQCELNRITCTCVSGAWDCRDDATQACNQRCPKDAGVDAHDAGVDATDAADQ